MTSQEKITFNANVVEVAKIDYLVENGFYSNRSDFLRAALRSQLDKHTAILADEVIFEKHAWDEPEGNKFTTIGVAHLSRKYLERSLARGKKVRLFVLGALIVANDVDRDLLEAAMESFKVLGTVKGPKEAVDFFLER